MAIEDDDQTCRRCVDVRRMPRGVMVARGHDTTGLYDNSELCELCWTELTGQGKRLEDTREQRPLVPAAGEYQMVDAKAEALKLKRQAAMAHAREVLRLTREHEATLA